MPCAAPPPVPHWRATRPRPVPHSDRTYPRVWAQSPPSAVDRRLRPPWWAGRPAWCVQHRGRRWARTLLPAASQRLAQGPPPPLPMRPSVQTLSSRAGRVLRARHVRGTAPAAARRAGPSPLAARGLCGVARAAASASQPTSRLAPGIRPVGPARPGVAPTRGLRTSTVAQGLKAGIVGLPNVGKVRPRLWGKVGE